MKYVALIILADVAFICFTVGEFHDMIKDLSGRKIYFDIRVR